MKRPTKKEIEESIRKLKDGSSGKSGSEAPQINAGKPAAAKSSKRIRKQGI